MARRRPQPPGGGRKESWAPNPARDIQVAIALGRVERLASLDDVTLDAVSDVVGALRFLLVEDVLKHCAASHGMRLLIRPPPGVSLDHTHPVPCISLACCGGCVIWGGRVIGGYLSEKCPTTTSAVPIAEDALYPVKVFLNQTAIIADGLKISRRSVLRYLALTLDSHFDTDRSDPITARLDRVRAGLVLRPGAEEGSVQFTLSGVASPHDDGTDQPLTRQLDAVHFQALVTCQLLMQSPSVLELKAVVDRVGR